MRITLKNYEKARSAVEAAREQLKLVKLWDDAVKQVGDLRNQRIVAITVNDDGTIRTECELTSAQPQASSGSPRPAAE